MLFSRLQVHTYPIQTEIQISSSFTNKTQHKLFLERIIAKFIIFSVHRSFLIHKVLIATGNAAFNNQLLQIWKYLLTVSVETKKFSLFWIPLRPTLPLSGILLFLPEQ